MVWMYGLGGLLAGAAVMGLFSVGPLCVFAHRWGVWTKDAEGRYEKTRRRYVEMSRCCLRCGLIQQREFREDKV